jgi:uncharacterized protein with GYD domain
MASRILRYSIMLERKPRCYGTVRHHWKIDPKGHPEHQRYRRAGHERRADHKAAGGKLLAPYYIIGRYDFVVIADLPSNEALIKFVIEIGKQSAVCTETTTALLPERVHKIAMET